MSDAQSHVHWRIHLSDAGDSCEDLRTRTGGFRRHSQKDTKNSTDSARHGRCRSRWEYCFPGAPSNRAGIEILTLIRTFLRVTKAMKKRLTSLMLLLVLAGGALAGVPLHFGEQPCSMDEAMASMDCCEAALMQSEAPDVAAAKLCFALNCAQNGTTSPPNIVRVSPPAPATPSSHPAITQPSLNSLLPLRSIDRSHGPPNSQPTYIRNLALLI